MHRPAFEAEGRGPGVPEDLQTRGEQVELARTSTRISPGYKERTCVINNTARWRLPEDFDAPFRWRPHEHLPALARREGVQLRWKRRC